MNKQTTTAEKIANLLDEQLTQDSQHQSDQNSGPLLPSLVDILSQDCLDDQWRDLSNIISEPLTSQPHKIELGPVSSLDLTQLATNDLDNIENLSTGNRLNIVDGQLSLCRQRSIQDLSGRSIGSQEVFDLDFFAEYRPSGPVYRVVSAECRIIEDIIEHEVCTHWTRSPVIQKGHNQFELNIRPLEVNRTIKAKYDNDQPTYASVIEYCPGDWKFLTKSVKGLFRDGNLILIDVYQRLTNKQPKIVQLSKDEQGQIRSEADRPPIVP